MAWALWLMKATIARIDTTPSTTATETERLGMTGDPSCSSGPRTERSTTRQYVNVPTTVPITRLLNGSRKNPWMTRGEYWLDACWMRSSDTEKAMPATVMVAPATVVRTARALSTVEVMASGRDAFPSVMRVSISRPTRPSATARPTKSMGMKNRLVRRRSTSAERRTSIATQCAGSGVTTPVAGGRLSPEREGRR